MIRAWVLVLAACGSGAPGAAEHTGHGIGAAKERRDTVSTLESKARDAIANGTVPRFFDDETTRDAAGLRAWLNGDTVPLDVFLGISRGHANLLTPGRARVLSQFEHLEKAIAELPPPGPGRPSGEPDLDMGDAGAPPVEKLEATRFVIASADSDHLANGAMRVLVAKQIENASATPDLDGLVSARAEVGLLGLAEPSPLVRLYGARLLPILATALRHHPKDRFTVRSLAEGLLGHEPDSDDEKLASELERWWHEAGPYLIVDDGVLPPYPGQAPWLVVDEYARFAGTEPVPTSSDDPARKAWEKLPEERRKTLATESEKKRKAEPGTWQAWFDEQKKVLRLP